VSGEVIGGSEYQGITYRGNKKPNPPRGGAVTSYRGGGNISLRLQAPKADIIGVRNTLWGKVFSRVFPDLPTAEGKGPSFFRERIICPHQLPEYGWRITRKTKKELGKKNLLTTNVQFSYGAIEAKGA